MRLDELFNFFPPLHIIYTYTIMPKYEGYDRLKTEPYFKPVAQPLAPPLAPVAKKLMGGEKNMAKHGTVHGSKMC